MDLLDELLYSTVRLEVSTPSGPSSGTGFFFSAQLDGKHVPLLVTNKHVVRGGTQVRLLLHADDGHNAPNGTSVYVDCDLAGVVNHPDPAVDLCGIAMAPVMAHAQGQGWKIFLRTIDRAHLPGVDPLGKPGSIEDILMIGYPNGLWDTANNMPIVRRGITATSPTKRFEGRPEFMIDAACFPGSSGSPVFMLERSALKPAPGVIVGRRFCFLGVLYGAPGLTGAGKCSVESIPTSSNTGSGLMHLGLAVHAAELLRFDEELKRLVAAAPNNAAAAR